MHKFGISASFINIIKSLYDSAALRVVTPEGVSDFIDIMEGVLQGEILSPLTFNMNIADMPQFVSSNNHGVPLNSVFD